MKTHRIIIASACLCIAQLANAESLGTYGRAYPIKERDAIDAMKDAVRKKLANGGQEQMIKGAQDRYLASLRNVTTPRGITPARATATRLVDLTETVKETITDGRGNVVVAAGTKINPLAVKPLTKKVFFIDAKDERQLHLVKQQASPNDKVILLGGSAFTANKFLKRTVYLDIPGLHKRMQVRKLPSVVSQQGQMLKVQEIAL